jgi:CRP-like cAMP-binding protein
MQAGLLRNGILAALPNDALDRWRPQLEHVDMPLGHVLYESGRTISHVYFPTSAIVSLLYVMENGASAEIAVVGREGMVGISLFMGGGSMASRALVQSAGSAFRLDSQLMKEEFERAGPTLRLLLRYTQALLTQTAQTAVCNRHHTLHQRLCRWLLLSLDRLQGTELVMTQSQICWECVVRSYESRAEVAEPSVIHYKRGRIQVVDRAGLEKCTCECYAVVKAEYDRLLPNALAA